MRIASNSLLIDHGIMETHYHFLSVTFAPNNWLIISG